MFVLPTIDHGERDCLPMLPAIFFFQNTKQYQKVTGIFLFNHNCQGVRKHT